MVRRREDMPMREVSVKVAKKAPREAREVPKLRRPLRIRRGGGSLRWLIVFVVVVGLLAGGWFAARAAIVGTSLLSGNNSSWLASLFHIKTTKLTGEDAGQVNILLIGNPGDPTHDGPSLTDSIIVASYNTTDKFLHLFSIPRDLQVTPAGAGAMKINAVYETGQTQNNDGPGLLTKTIENITGLTIPYYIRVDFSGFAQLVDELGGIKVVVKKDLLDTQYPADIGTGYQTVDIKAGTYTMDGATALKYARSRESTSDFDRSRRQQDILLAIWQKAKDLNLLTAPAKLLAIDDVIKNHMGTNLNNNEMTRLIQLFADFDPTHIANHVIDDASGMVVAGKDAAGAYILTPVGGDYTKIKDFVAGTVTQTAVPATVQTSAMPLKIEVLNGTNVTGLAGKAASKLKAAGYTIIRVGNNATKGVAKTTVYGNGDATLTGAFQALAGAASGAVSTNSVTLGSGVDARVVVGADYPTQ